MSATLMRRVRILAGAGAAVLALAGCATEPGQRPGQETVAIGSPLVDTALGNYLAARVARLQRDTDVAARYYAVALEDDPENPRLVGGTMLMVLIEGDMERAFTLAERRLKTQETDSTARLTLAVRAMKEANWSEAREHLQKSRKTGVATLLHPMLESWIAVAEGNGDEARDALDGLRAQNAFDPFRLFHAALANDVLGSQEIAAEFHRKSVENGASAATRVILAYAAHLTRDGRQEEASRLLADYLSEFPENAVIVDAENHLKTRGTVAMPVTNAVQGAAEALMGAAGALLRDRTSQGAVIYLRLALYLRPDLDAAHMLLGDLLEANSRFEQSNAAYANVKPESPYYWDARIRIASNLNRLDKTEETLTLLRDMADKRTKDTTALVAAGDILRSRERYREAVGDYDRAIARIEKLDPRHWAILYARGIALERSKQWDRAEKDFLKALELRPEHPLVLNYLGYSWIEKGINMAEARKMIERAVEQRPNDGYIVDSLGWVLYRIGEFEEAVKHLERAVSLRPEDPVINEHLGDAYWRTGRRLEARFQWRHALALGAESEEAKQIRIKLRDGLPPIGAVKSDT